VAVKTQLFPVDWLLSAYNILFAFFWIGVAPRAGYAGWVVLAHLLAAVLPWVLLRLPQRATRPARILRDVYPLVGLALFWSELRYLQALRGLPPNDAAVAELDSRVFGVHLHELWMPAMPAPLLSETMHAIYFLYYALVFLPPIAVAISGRTLALREMVLRLMVTYLGCYVVYVLFPVYGPRVVAHAAGAPIAPIADGFFARLVASAQAAGDSPGTAFPSSHVAGAFTMAWLAFRCLPRWAAWGLLAQALGVFLATIYTRNHFTIDGAAGLALVLVLQGFLAPALLGRVGEGTARPVVPILPKPVVGGACGYQGATR
jgi:membrane-associated phospholipid phosphatase